MKKQHRKQRKHPGPEPELLKIEGDPATAFQALFRPIPKAKKKKPKKPKLH